MDDTADAAPRQLLVYDGRIGELYRIFLLNLLLIIVTFGIYRFWATTSYRRYLWSRMRFMDTRFEYTGVGYELFVGFLMAIGILIGMAIGTGILSVLFALMSPILAIVPLIGIYVVIFILFGAAHFSAQRYRLSRTQWRGIRGGMQGSAFGYGAWSLLYLILVPLTLFQMVPWMTIRLTERRINASRFGDIPFIFKGRARAVYLPYLLTLVGTMALLGVVAAVVYNMEASVLGPVFLDEVSRSRAQMTIGRAVPTIIAGLLVFSVGAGLIACWYSAVLARHIFGNTTFAGLRFASSVTARCLLWLILSNGSISLFTLGLGFPVVLQRSMRYLVLTTRVTGELAPETIHQSPLAKPSTGEGMLNVLDSGSGIL
jgi:uncharacterized membrane protein YjgN (DUF898 family)